MDPLLDAYLGYLPDDAAAVVRVTEDLARPGGLPVPVHCTASKERTGLAIALLLDAIGVRRVATITEHAAGA